MTENFGLAAGRRARNARRALLAERRRLRLVQLLREVPVGRHGWKSRLAKELGCSRKVISNDIRAIARRRNQMIAQHAERRADERENLRMRMAILLRASGYTGPMEGSDDDPDGIAEDQHR